MQSPFHGIAQALVRRAGKRNWDGQTYSVKTNSPAQISIGSLRRGRKLTKNGRDDVKQNTKSQYILHCTIRNGANERLPEINILQGTAKAMISGGLQLFTIARAPGEAEIASGRWISRQGYGTVLGGSPLGDHQGSCLVAVGRRAQRRKGHRATSQHPHATSWRVAREGRQRAVARPRTLAAMPHLPKHQPHRNYKLMVGAEVGGNALCVHAKGRPYLYQPLLENNIVAEVGTEEVVYCNREHGKRHPRLCRPPWMPASRPNFGLYPLVLGHLSPSAPSSHRHPYGA